MSKEPEKPAPCKHGNPPPWFNCEECRKESHYSFRGNFK